MEVVKQGDWTLIKENGKTRMWIPKHELEAMEEMNKNMTPEERKRTAYFFWNNFSMEGYDN